MQLVLTPELILEAYKQGLFPMAYSADSLYVQWLCPEERGQLPIEDIHIPKSLKKTVLKNAKRNGPYSIKINTAFELVMRQCADPKEDRPETWINQPLINAFCELHKKGHAHSIECWRDDVLVGGLYGVSIGSAFFGESMFSRANDTSKIALIHLCARLWKGGYKILDTQFTNNHLQQFGVYEVPYGRFMVLLKDAAEHPANFFLEGLSEVELIDDFLQNRGADGLKE